MQESYVPECPREQSVEHNVKRFWASWHEEEKLSKEARNHPSLALWRTYRNEVLTYGVTQAIFALTQLGQPYVVGELVGYVVSIRELFAWVWR